MNDKHGKGNDSMADNAVSAVAGQPDSDGQQHPSRAQARQARERAARGQRPGIGLKSLLRRWWIYPILVAALLCLYLGLESANTDVPQQPTVVVKVPSD